MSLIFGNSSFLKHICRILNFYLHCRVGTFQNYSETSLIRHALGEKFCFGIDRVSDFTM